MLEGKTPGMPRFRVCRETAITLRILETRPSVFLPSFARAALVHTLMHAPIAADDLMGGCD